MVVLVRMDHELDAALNTVLLALTNLLKDGTHDCVDTFLAHCDNGIDQLVLNCGIVRIYPFCRIRFEDRLLISILYNYGVDYTLYDPYIRVDSLRLRPGFHLNIKSELGLGLLEHSFLLSRNPCSFPLFFPSDFPLMLGDLVSSALAAPTLALTRAEVVDPSMTLAALDANNSLILIDNHSNLSLMLLSLALHSIDYLDTVVADAMHLVRELPEFSLTAAACPLALLPMLLLLLLMLRLLLPTLLNSCSELVVVSTVIAVACFLASCTRSWSAWLGSFILSCRFSAVSFLLPSRHYSSLIVNYSCTLGLRCNACKVWSVHCHIGARRNNDVISDYFCKDVVNRVTSWLMCLLSRLLMRRVMVRSVVMWMSMLRMRISLLLMIHGGGAIRTPLGPVFADLGDGDAWLLLTSETLTSNCVLLSVVVAWGILGWRSLSALLVVSVMLLSVLSFGVGRGREDLADSRWLNLLHFSSFFNREIDDFRERLDRLRFVGVQ